MSEKQFKIESDVPEIEVEKKSDYRTRILKIVNDLEIAARVVNPDSLLHTELHEKKLIDARKEKKEFEAVRRDVCESFGIKFDDEHVYIHDDLSHSVSEVSNQRAIRAFFVLIDAVRAEGFYAEGRIDHNTLFRRLTEMMEKKVPGLDFDTIASNLDNKPRSFLVFKGFLSVKDFQEISDASRKVLETPLHDKDGEEIQTAENWFLTGHNLD